MVKVYGILAMVMSVTFVSVMIVKLNADLNESMTEPDNPVGSVAVKLAISFGVIGWCCLMAMLCFR